MKATIIKTQIVLAASILLAAVHHAGAASFTISSNSTTAQTLGSGSGQTGTVNAGVSQTVSGSTVAVTITGNNATLTNLGTISQTGTGRVIRDNTGVTGLIINNGSITNSTALMQAADADVIQMNVAGGSAILNNYGTMTSLNTPTVGGNQAVDFSAITTGANTINNFSTGIMQATEADAVRPGVNGVVNNAGTMKSTSSTGSSSDGVDVQSNTGVVITNASGAGPGTGTNLIEGARHGITGGPATNIAFTTSVTNNLGGTIQGDNGSGINLDGFGALQTATIVNGGTITGNGHDIGNGVSHDGDGLDVDGLVNVTNTGIIRSINSFNIAADGVAHSEGITVGGGTVTNSGTIEGLVSAGNTNAIGFGITFLGNDVTSGPLAGTREAIYGNASVTNQAGGLIRGDSASGIFVDGPASGFTVTINNNAGATIRGGGVTMAAIQTAADNDTISNAGSIDGSSSGKAIDMGAGSNALNIYGGSASVNGDISGGTGGTNTLLITPGASNSFSYSGAISNFNSVQIGSSFTNNSTTYTGGTVTLSGTGTYSGNTGVNAGKLLVTGSISGSASVASGATLGSGHNQTSAVGAVTATSNASGGGTLAPGDTGGSGLASIGKLNVNGALSLGTVGTAGTAHLAIELGGYTAGTQYDQIATTGGVTLGNVSLDGTFVNGLGATIANGDLFFIVINGGGAITTSFANQSALADTNGFHTITFTGGQQFEISYTASANALAFAAAGNDIALRAVPEPNTVVIFIGCAGMVTMFRRRKKSQIGQ
jgi:hypothetical protein